MGKDKRQHGRKRRKDEASKRDERRQARVDAWCKTMDGAGARDIYDPQRHRRH